MGAVGEQEVVQQVLVQHPVGCKASRPKLKQVKSSLCAGDYINWLKKISEKSPEVLGFI